MARGASKANNREIGNRDRVQQKVQHT